MSRRPRAALGLRTGLLFAFLLPALLIWGLSSWLSHARIRALLDAQVAEGLVAVAATAASQISGDRVAAIQVGDDQAGLRSWTHLSEQLQTFRAEAGLRRVLVVDLEGRVRGDTGRHEPGQGTVPPLPVGALVPELGQDVAELRRARGGQPTASLVTFRGIDGADYRRGYAPLRDAEGTVVGLLAVEGSSGAFQVLRRHAITTALFGGLVALTLVLAALLVATALGRPFRRLRDAARRIGGGDLVTPVENEPRIAELAEVSHAMETMRRELQARDRQLKMMLAGVAHEVKNPLGGMELFSGLLAEELAEVGTDDARAHLTRIRAEIGYLTRIVGDFLAFARERTLEPVDFEATEWLGQARALLGAVATSRGVEVQVDAAPARLHGDQDLLTAAVVNLLQNALQASTTGNRVSLEGTITPTSYEVRVRDAGAGISQEMLEQIFEPFFTTREQGTGLGLPLSRKIVEAHGGTLSALSTGAETCFTLRLPLRTASPPD